MIRTTIVLLGLATAFAPSSAHAWGVNLDITGKNSQFVNRDAGAVSERMSTTGTHLRLGAALNKHLSIEGNWHTFKTDAWLLGELGANTDADILTAGASYAWRPVSWMRPFIRGAVGIGTTGVAFHQSTTATGRVTAPTLSAAGGFELLIKPGTIVRGRDFTMGFTLEFGWMHVFHSDLTLSTERTTTPETTATEIDAGALGWSAFTTRFGLVVRI
ncbi:MAG: hypothetical protein KC502_19625 [Myxococcales bacterium]|nr:hypothetical protein [Myxococcales bacterium]